MILGVTGTRHGLTVAQLAWLRAQLPLFDELHHGACVGADAAAHQTATELRVPVVVHPPADQRLMMPPDGYGAWLPPRPYLERNRFIVAAADVVIALPDGPESRRGGTWYTVRYAESVDKPVWLCFPDGRVEVRGRLTTTALRKEVIT